jgi:MoaA/NifB/PqqE/SkfB family radical SAM enzyme
MNGHLAIVDGVKQFRSENYNYNFRLSDGNFERWGKTEEEDPAYSPFGGEILDIETSTICTMGCKFCYKSNTGVGQNMSFETFKIIFDKMPKYNGIHFLTQIAFGIGDIDATDDLWEMMAYCRANDVIPNITINGARLTDEIVANLVRYCGAVSVSCYDDKNVCYDAVKRLTDAGLKQVNIHSMISEETFERAFTNLYDYHLDTRLRKLNAIVLLSLKQKGRGTNFTILTDDNFAALVVYALDKKVPIGFDSCGCGKFLDVAHKIGKYAQYIEYAEPCESCSFSQFIDVDGVFHPCSFATDCGAGIDVLKVNDFMADVWNAKTTCTERKRIQDNDRNCPYFTV